MEEYTKNNMQVIKIDNYMSLEEFFTVSLEVNLDDISFNVLWDSQSQLITKGFIFAFRYENKLYNILLNDEITLIDERVVLDSITEEKFLKIDTSKNDYNYALLKHDESGSTIYTMYYTKEKTTTFGHALEASEAYTGISDIINTLKSVEGIDNVLSIKRIESDILNDIEKHIGPSL